MGKTISLAGSPNINAVSITPSRPNRAAKGFKKELIMLSKLLLFIWVLASSHITAPDGAATITARHKTPRVLSNTERTNTFINCGFLKGGSSSVNEDFSPLRSVTDKIFVNRKVKSTQPIIITVKNSEVVSVPFIKPIGRKNKDNKVISVGYLPLQGIKLLVSIASKRSRFESIILQPVTPAALQPSPIHIQSDCFPQALHLLNGLSRLYATLGRYPKSSRSVKSGKNIAIGGSITATTQPITRKLPFISIPFKNGGNFK